MLVDGGLRLKYKNYTIKPQDHALEEWIKGRMLNPVCGF